MPYNKIWTVNSILWFFLSWCPLQFFFSDTFSGLGRGCKYIWEACNRLCERAGMLRQQACSCFWRVLSIVQTHKAGPSYRSCSAEKFIVCNRALVSFLENTYAGVWAFPCLFPCEWIYAILQLIILTTTKKVSTLVLFYKQYFLLCWYFQSICVYLETNS